METNLLIIVVGLFIIFIATIISITFAIVKGRENKKLRKEKSDLEYLNSYKENELTKLPIGHNMDGKSIPQNEMYKMKKDETIILCLRPKTDMKINLKYTLHTNGIIDGFDYVDIEKTDEYSLGYIMENGGDITLKASDMDMWRYFKVTAKKSVSIKAYMKKIKY